MDRGTDFMGCFLPLPRRRYATNTRVLEHVTGRGQRQLLGWVIVAVHVLTISLYVRELSDRYKIAAHPELADATECCRT